MHQRVRTGLLTAIACSVAVSTDALALTITSDLLLVYAQPEEETVFDVAFPIDVPDSGTLSVESGASAASTSYEFSESGLSLAFEHSVAPHPDAYAASPTEIHFIPDTGMRYRLSGSYSAVAADDREVYLRVTLRDDVDLVPLFESYQSSFATPDESFTVGESGGDEYNSLIGSLSGTLLADHQYRLYVLATVAGMGGDPPLVAFASGEVRLELLPEPGSPALGLAALLGLAASRRRRASRPGRAANASPRLRTDASCAVTET